MAESTAKIRYPRRRVIRAILRLLGQMLVLLLARVTITGRENFPKKGPLILIANHVDSSDGLLLMLFAPYLAETMVAADLPFPGVVRFLLNLYGHISVLRGAADGVATRQALSVLEQGGVVILFPEGAIWRAAGMPIHTGAAWLSQKAQAPVLPIGLMGTRRAFIHAFRLKRPHIGLVVGKPIPAVAPAPGGVHDKAALQRSIETMMLQVEAMIPPEDRQQVVPVDKMKFDFQVTLHGQSGQMLASGLALTAAQADSLGKVYYDLELMKTLYDSMKLPVQALIEPGKPQEAAAVTKALQAMFHYLDHDYPHFFSYRFGKDQGITIREGFETLRHMAQLPGVQHMVMTPSAQALPETA